MREHTVGQAVVTDPLLEGASGYVMTAVSESVTVEDQAHLTERPQVSDFMHMEKTPGRFLSFHPLPSGSWALSHRFVHGTRRRAYNRVVVHTLVVSPELLDAVLGDAWLLVAGCRYCDPEGEWRMFTELADCVREPDVREVENLPVRLPEDPLLARYYMLRGRCDFLKRSWGGPEDLRSALSQVLSALEAGCGVLLPQEMVMEQLMALAWSVLPRQDRLRTPWTTHLATGGGEIFRLALVPRPTEARFQQSNPEQWLLLGEPTQVHDGAGEALAKAVVSHFDQFSEIEKGFQSYGLSFEPPSGVAGWVHWILEGGKLPPEGFEDARELASFLDRHGIFGEASLRSRRWLIIREFLDVVALTIVNQYRRRNDRRPSVWEKAVQEVAEVLTARELTNALVDVDHLIELVSQAKGAREAQAAMGALALFLASPDWKLHRESRERLLFALQARSRARGALAHTAGLEATPVFARFAESVVHLASDKAEAAYDLVQQNGGLAAALGALEARLAFLIHLQSILRVAQKRGDTVIAGQVASQFLVPLLAKDPAQAQNDGLGQDVLNALRGDPAGLAQAFKEWKDGNLYDEAVGTLRQWAHDKAPESLTVAECLASETYNGVSDLIRKRRSILGTAQTLMEAGTRVACWLAFALVEAELLDEAPDPEGLRLFRIFLTRAPVQETRLELPLERLLARFHRKPPAVLGAAHRALVISLAGPLGQRAAQTATALERLTDPPRSDLLLWGGAVSAVAGAAVKAGIPASASLMACHWWEGLRIGNLTVDQLPESALRLLDLLTKQDAEAVLKRWAPNIAALGSHQSLQIFIERLQRLAQEHEKPDLEFLCGVGRLAWLWRHQGGSLPTAVGEAFRLAAALHQTDVQLASALPHLLPPGTVESARAILDLLVSREVSREIKEVLDKRLLHRALEVPPWGLPRALPPVEDLARNNFLLVKVSKKMGRSWPQFPEEAVAFVDRLTDLGRSDAIGSFFRGAAELKKESFVLYLEGHAPALYRALREAARHPVGRWDLSRVKELMER